MRQHPEKCSSPTNKIILSPLICCALSKAWKFCPAFPWSFILRVSLFSCCIAPLSRDRASVPGVSPGTCLLSFGHKGSFFRLHSQASICSFSFLPWVSLLFSLSFVVFVWLFWVIVHFAQPLPRHWCWHHCLPPPLWIPFQLPDVFNLCGFCILTLSS